MSFALKERSNIHILPNFALKTHQNGHKIGLNFPVGGAEYGQVWGRGRGGSTGSLVKKVARVRVCRQGGGREGSTVSAHHSRGSLTEIKCFHVFVVLLSFFEYI